MDKQQKHTLFDAYYLGEMPEQERINFEQDLKKDTILKHDYDLYLAVVNILKQQGENDLRKFLSDKNETLRITKSEQAIANKNESKTEGLVNEGIEPKKGKVIPFYFKAIAATIVFFIASYFLINTIENKTTNIARTEEKKETTIGKSKEKSNKTKDNSIINDNQEVNKRSKTQKLNNVEDNASFKIVSDSAEILEDTKSGKITSTLVDTIAVSKEIKGDNVEGASIVIKNSTNTKIKNSNKDDEKIEYKEFDKDNKKPAIKIKNTRGNTPNKPEIGRLKVKRDRNILDTQLMLNNYGYELNKNDKNLFKDNSLNKEVVITNTSPPKKYKRKNKKALKNETSTIKDSTQLLPPLVYYKLMINESPINYKGYKFDNKTKLINVYGLKTTNLEFYYMKNDYYLRSENKVYIMKNTLTYSPLIEVKDPEIIKIIKEYSAY